MIDSSPQCGMDLEIMLQLVINEADLDAILDCVGNLASLDRSQCHESAQDRRITRRIRQESLIIERLGSMLKKRILPPVALGLQEAGVPRKFSAVAHQQYLECAGPAELATAFREFFAGTLDQGVEFALASMGPQPFSSVFPWYPLASRAAYSPEAEDAEFATELVDHALDLSGFIPVAGNFHIIGNSAKDFKNTVRHYDYAIRGLTLISWLCRDGDPRKRLLATCFADEVHRHMRTTVESFKGKPKLDRWGYVCECIMHALIVKDPLRYGWDHRKFASPNHKRKKREEKEEEGVNLDELDNYIREEFFWDVLVMLDMLHCMEREAIRWTNACSCHEGLDWGGASPEERELWKRCPMRGLRAPEMANGDFWKAMGRITQNTAADLLVKLSPRLSPAQRTDIMDSFVSAQQSFLGVLAIRLGFWLEWPWRLFAGGAPGEDRFRAIIDEALNCPCDHPLIKEIQGPGELGIEAVSFAMGTPLSVLPLMRRLKAKLMCLPVGEQDVEGVHARIGKAGVPQHCSSCLAPLRMQIHAHRPPLQCNVQPKSTRNHMASFVPMLQDNNKRPSQACELVLLQLRLEGPGARGPPGGPVLLRRVPQRTAYHQGAHFSLQRPGLWRASVHDRAERHTPSME